MEIVIRLKLDPAQVSLATATTLAAEAADYVEGMVETHPAMRGGMMTGAVAVADHEVSWSVDQ